MSLTRQLWLAVMVVMLLAFGGTFAISTSLARSYLTQQLRVKNIDNATAMALSISQMPKDLVTIELLISAQFDAGHYRLIQLVDPDGKVLVERRGQTPTLGAPEAFVRLIPINVEAGVAQVQDGWKQFGTLTVESQDGYAYVDLWQGAVRLLGGFAIASLLVGGFGTMLLRFILRPLGDVVSQANAMRQRRFLHQKEPRTLEFRKLVRAMNGLTTHVQQVLEEESRRADQLRLQAEIDPVTGLSNRNTLMAALEDSLQRNDASASGTFLILRMEGLAELNQQIGRPSADERLRSIGERLARSASDRPIPWTVARLNAGDFAILAPGETQTATLALDMLNNARLALDGLGSYYGLRAGVTHYDRTDSRAAVVARADGALSQAQQNGSELVVAPLPTPDTHLPTDLPGWRQALSAAMQADGIQLAHFPVKDREGRLLHLESPLRLRLDEHWMPAAHFISWAIRLDLMPKLDLLVVDAALSAIESGSPAISATLSAETIRDPGFNAALIARLKKYPPSASGLWFEVPEYGALRDVVAFREFCRAVKPLGCRIGLKHVGRQFSRIAELRDLGIDYLKIDGAFINGTRDSADHQAFLRSLCTVAHTIGITTIATGVNRSDDVSALSALGIDAFTGPAIKT